METLATGINKPRLIVGIDKRLFVVCFLLASGVFWACQLLLGFGLSLLITASLFAACCVGASRLTDIDPQAFRLMGSLLRQRPVYDIGRRDNSRVVIEEA